MPPPKGKISIIGAGQAGLLLGIALVKKKYNVSIVSDRTAEQIYRGRILSNQAMFDTALAIERKHDLNFWDEQCPKKFSTTMTLLSPDLRHRAITWTGHQKKFYQSVDQRMKFSYWLEEFENHGGQVVIKKTTPHDLERITEISDLTIVSTGKSDLSHIFPRDERYSAFNKPQRALACLYVKNMSPPAHDVEGVHVNVIPGIGEYLIMPGLTTDGRCDMMQFEGIPGGPFDSWDIRLSPHDYLTHAVKLLRKYVPWEAERCNALELCDDQAILAGSFTPIIRKPVAKLKNGKIVFGLGDTVVLNDPLAGQGANNATKAADFYYESIIANNAHAFNEAWMNETFEGYWNKYGKWATRWSNILLSPPPPHIIEFLHLASRSKIAANILSNGFNDPDTLFPWIENQEETRRLIAGIEAEKKEFIFADITAIVKHFTPA